MTLVNGLQGIVQEMHDDFVKVSFPDIGAVEIRTFNFTKYDSKVKYDVGSRTQLPLKLSFCCNCSQVSRNDSGESSDRLQRDV